MILAVIGKGASPVRPLLALSAFVPYGILSLLPFHPSLGSINMFIAIVSGPIVSSTIWFLNTCLPGRAPPSKLSPLGAIALISTVALTTAFPGTTSLGQTGGVCSPASLVEGTRYCVSAELAT